MLLKLCNIIVKSQLKDMFTMSYTCDSVFRRVFIRKVEERECSEAIRTRELALDFVYGADFLREFLLLFPASDDIIK